MSIVAVPTRSAALVKIFGKNYQLRFRVITWELAVIFLRCLSSCAFFWTSVDWKLE